LCLEELSLTHSALDLLLTCLLAWRLSPSSFGLSVREAGQKGLCSRAKGFEDEEGCSARSGACFGKEGGNVRVVRSRVADSVRVLCSREFSLP
ncbi:hypothetical protein BKA82DRAFT_4202106, partial [Pisolithus tinctorius]